MIVLHIGKIGEGKSYSCTWEIWKWLRKGVDVYANWDINFTSYLKKRERSFFYRFINRNRKWGKLYFFTNIQDIYGIVNGQIYIDEAHTWLGSREYRDTPKEFITKMSQSRKYKTDLHFICQYASQIESVVRNLCNIVVVHTKFFGLMRFKEYDGIYINSLDEPEKKPKSIITGWVIFRKAFANSYNTFQILGNNFPPFSNTPVWSIEQYRKLKLVVPKPSIKEYKVYEKNYITNNIRVRSLSDSR